MRDSIVLGYTPKEESAAQSATEENRAQAYAYHAQLEAAFPEAHFQIIRNRYGAFHVEVVFDDADIPACTAAQQIACGLTTWSPHAASLLANRGYPVR